MQGKVVVTTGVTSGIGQAAAEKLAVMGARIVGVARDPVRGESTLRRLDKSGAGHSMHYADLSRISEMKRIAAEIAAAEPRIDVLINNAAAALKQRRVTEDGLEATFAINHMAYFVLTHGLLPRLLASASARIVNTASMMHGWAKLDFNDLQSEKGYSGTDVYAKSKLANVMFTLELARRLRGTGVTVNCLHPGFVKTRLGSEDGGKTNAFGLSMAGAMSPEDGSRTTVYVASSKDLEGVSGKYFVSCRMEELKAPARDESLARRLWKESERLAGIKW